MNHGHSYDSTTHRHHHHHHHSFIDCTRKDAVAARLYWLPLQAGLVAFHAPPAESRHGMIGIGSI